MNRHASILQAVIASLATYRIRGIWLRTGLIRLEELERRFEGHRAQSLEARSGVVRWLRSFCFRWTLLRKQVGDEGSSRRALGMEMGRPLSTNADVGGRERSVSSRRRR